MRPRKGRKLVGSVTMWLEKLDLTALVHHNISPRAWIGLTEWEIHSGFLGITAGWAFGTGRVIELHEELFKPGREKDLKDTLMHEVAHAVDKILNGALSGHGQPWKEIMRSMKQTGDRCHSYGYLSRNTMGGILKCNKCHKLEKTRRIDTQSGRGCSGRGCGGSMFKCS